jgi:hypothetical protein
MPGSPSVDGYVFLHDPRIKLNNITTLIKKIFMAILVFMNNDIRFKNELQCKIETAVVQHLRRTPHFRTFTLLFYTAYSHHDLAEGDRQNYPAKQ